jgi:DNA processing protein
MQYTGQEKYWIWMASAGIAPKTFYYIMKEFGGADSFFDAVKNGSELLGSIPDEAVAAAKAACSDQHVAEIIAELETNDIAAVTRLSDDYPALLAQIPYPPPVLFIRGSFEGIFTDGRLDCLSIVGTRQCTRRGAELTQRIAGELAEAGVTIVSGMARGIDSSAHLGALDGEGKTIAVLGCGADVVYPPESGDIYRRAAENGAVVSELPAGTKPFLSNFPARNRIIAGLSRGTLVVESDIKGGTTITTSMAISMGRDVFAVPGAPYMRTAALSDMLISNGAYPVQSAADILDFYGLAEEKKDVSDGSEHIQLDFLQRQIYNLLLQGDTSVENMASCIKYPQSEINSALTMMELGGLIKRLPGGKYGV